MGFITIHNRLVHYQYADNNQPHTLVFINSLGTDLRIWDTVVDLLGTSVNTLRYDKRGHGLSEETLSDSPETGTMAAFRDDLAGLLDALSIDQCIPVGLSVGGRIALMLADRQPQWVKKLILCDTAHIIGTRQSWNERIQTVQTKGLIELSPLIMDRWFPPDFRQKQAGQVGIFQRMVAGCAPIDYIRCCEAIRDADLTDEARRITVPTCCLVGSEDVATPPDLVKSLAELIPNAQFEVLAGSGHLPCVDNPGGLTNLIIEFLNG